MKIIALEEHFTMQSVLDAHADHPLLGMYRTLEERAWARGGASVLRALTDVGEQRLAVMDAHGVDVQVLSQVVPGPEDIAGAEGVRLAEQTNDLMAEVVAGHPDRFAAFATLPLSDPGAAAKELTRAVQELGFPGVLINGHVRGRYLDHPEFRPVLEVAEGLDVPIYLHPTRPPQAVVDACYSGYPPLIQEIFATAGWGWHIDTALHTLRLIIGGVFERFPRLQVILGHMGEGLPAMLWRSNAVLNSVLDLPKPVAQYVADHVHITTSGVLDDVAFGAARAAVGVERLMFSVDYPFQGTAESRAYLDRLPVEDADRERIAHSNAERLLRLPT